MYPKLRFKGFDDAWEQRKFKDVGTVSMCKRIFKEETSEEGDIPFFKIGTFGGIPDAFISRELFDEYKSKYSYPEPGDILLSASGTIGRIVEYEGEEAYFQDSNIVWLSHDKSVDNKFLKVLYSIVKWDGIEGSTIKRLYNDNFLKTQFMLPSIEEQKKIGSFFEQLDNLITLHQRQCEALKKQKRFFLQNMFPKEGESEPRIRFNGFTEPWEQRKFKDFTKQTGIRNKENLDLEPYSITNETGFVPQKDAHDEFGYMKNTDRSAYSIVSPNSFAYNPARINVGSIGYYKGDKNVIVSSLYEVFQTDKDIDDSFLWIWFKSSNFFNWINKLQEGSVRQYFYYDKLCECKLPVPSLKEQEKIGTFFSKLDNLITLHQRQYEQLVSLKKYLLSKMFI